MEPRALIGYLVGWDSRNIYRIWIPTKKRIYRCRDVTFDDNKQYDPSELDLAYVLQENELHELINITEHQPHSEDEDSEEELVLNAPKQLQEGHLQATKRTQATEKSSNPQSLPTPPPTDASSSTPPPSDTSSTPAPNASSSTPAPNTGTVRPSWEYQSASIPAPRTTDISADMSESLILPSRTRNRRQAHAVNLMQIPQLSGFHAAFNADLTTDIKRSHRDGLPPEPKNWTQLLRHPHKDQWIQAANIEFEHLTKRETFETVSKDTATEANILPLTWVFKYKFDTDGFLLKHKARLCVRGDLQKTDKDTYAATLALKTFRALMALTAAFDLEARQYDAVNAFLNSTINELIYVSCPEGLPSTPNTCLRLLRALYGLKQSPLLWLQEVSSKLQDLGLHPVPGIDCLFTNGWLLLFFYVDDFVMLYDKRHQSAYTAFEKSLLQTYEIRKLGDLSWFLGIRILRDRAHRKLWLCQDSYIEKLAIKFNLQTKRTNTPLLEKELIPYDGVPTNEQIYSYQQRVGSLTFAATTTRPDISFATSLLAQFLTKPSPAHLEAANHVLAYLNSTKTLAIEYIGQESEDHIFLADTDAAFADDSITRKSSYGYLFRLFGGPIDWKASKQATVTTSSTEAELLSLSETARQAVWWNRFFDSIDFHTDQDLYISCDNLQTINLMQADTPKLSTRLRHVDIHRHWLRQEVQNGKIHTKWIPTAEMPADGLTKSLPRQKHERFINLLHLVDIAPLI